jgi:hypothetical protein
MRTKHQNLSDLVEINYGMDFMYLVILLGALKTERGTLNLPLVSMRIEMTNKRQGVPIPHLALNERKLSGVVENSFTHS